MLVGNGHMYNKSPGRSLGGGSEAGTRGAWFKSGPRRNAFIGETRSYIPQSSVPATYSPPYCWTIAIDAGGLGSRQEMRGSGDLTAHMAMGRNCSATLSGSGDIVPPSLSLLTQLACTILGQGGLSANMVGTVQMAATLAGQGDLDGALSMISWMTANLTGSGTVSPSSSMFGTANMSANIYVNTGTASAKELAAEVWESLAADFNNAGTMGQKLNGAGSAGDPWTTALPGPYAAGTAGKIVGDKLLTWQKFLALK